MSHTPVPVVSVIIPAYRAAKYIDQALDSVLAQTFVGYEIIVVNDASPDSDELEQVLTRFRDVVRYVKHSANQGPGAARNTGIRAARGDYLAFLDADDYWDSASRRADGVPGQHPGVALVYSDARLFVDGSDETIGLWMNGNPSTRRAHVRGPAAAGLQRGRRSVVVRRQGVCSMPGFFPIRTSGTIPRTSTWYVRLAKRGARLAATERTPLMYRRIHPESLSAESENLRRGALKVLRKTAERTDLTRAERASLARTSGKRRGRQSRARRAWRSARGDFARALELVRPAHAFYRTWKLKVIMVALWLFPGLLRRAHRLRAFALTRRERRARSHSLA